MKNLITKLTSNIGTKLKKFCLWSYLFECLAGFIAGIIGFIWGLGEGLGFYSMLFIYGGMILPLVLYPIFMFFYGYAIMVHKMESDMKENATDKSPSFKAPSFKAPSFKLPSSKVDIGLICLVVLMIALLLGIGFLAYKIFIFVA